MDAGPDGVSWVMGSMVLNRLGYLRYCTSNCEFLSIESPLRAGFPIDSLSLL